MSNVVVIGERYCFVVGTLAGEQVAKFTEHGSLSILQTVM